MAARVRARRLAPAAALPLLLLGAAAGSGCIQDDGRRWSPARVVEVSEEDEREEGHAFDAWARENLDLIEDPVVMGFVNDLGQAMVRTIEPQPFVYRFRVIRDPSLNAFAVPGGYIYFHSGTILRAGRLDEVAGVMGHEIAHVKQRHYKRQREANAIPALLTQIAAIGATVAARNPAPLIVAAGVNVAVQLRYSRAFEEEADRFGSVYVTRSGYDVDGMARFFERILAEERASLGAFEPPPYLYTHPDVEERIDAVRDLAAGLRPVRAPDPDLRRAFRDTQARLAWLERTGRTLWRGAQLPADRERSDPALARAAELAERGDAEAALAVLRGAERLAPADPRLPFRRGELLEEAGRLPEAARAYRRAVQLDPTTGLVLYRLGRVYAELGDRHRAVYYLEQSTLHLGDASAVGRAAEREIERATFPVVARAGLARGFEDGEAVEPREDFAAGPVVWWARVAGRHTGRREDLRVRWLDPRGETVREGPVRTHRRPWVSARLEAVPREGEWAVEARLDGRIVDRRVFRVARVPPAPAQPAGGPPSPADR